MRVLATIGSCIFFALASFAQTPADAPASKEDVQRYLEVMHSHEMMKQMTVAMSKPMHHMVHEQYLKDKDQLPPDFEERMNKIMDEMMNSFPFDEMIDAMIPAYQKHLTRGDIDALVAFYSAPTGQKLLREMPAMTAEAMESMMPIMRKSIDRMTAQVQQQVDEVVKQSAKTGHRAAATDH